MPTIARRMLSITALAALLTQVCLSGCGRQSPEAATTSHPRPDAWSVVVDDYVESYFKAHPAFAVWAGRHEYDGLLPDWSAAGIRAESVRLHRFRQRVSSFPATRLSRDQQIERDYLLSRIDVELFWIDEANAPFRNPAYYLGRSDSNESIGPSVYVVRPYAPARQRLQAFIRYAQSVVRAAPEIRKNLKTPLPRAYIHLGVAGFGGLADYYRKDVPLAFADVSDPKLQADLRTSAEAAAAAMQDLAAWLQAQLATATDNDALGTERYARMLQMTERIDLPLAAIEAAGRADLQRNRDALTAECARFAPHRSLVECIARADALKAPGGAVAGARDQLQVLRQFVIDNDILTVPDDQQAEVAEAPPFNRQNFAFLEAAGPYDRSLPSVYYIAPPDPAWPKAEQLAYVPGRSSLLFGSVHEVWPGHFVHYQRANQSHSRLAALFPGYAYTEGWAHYAEEMMWEKGLGGDAESHIGQLQNALLRNVRLLASIGLHTGGMTLGEAERLFRNEAFVDAGNARQQAARGMYDPGYLNYTLGKLMIRRLREDYCRNRGGVACWKQFHDTFLEYGGPPIPIVRQAMLPEDTAPLL